MHKGWIFSCFIPLQMFKVFFNDAHVIVYMLGTKELRVHTCIIYINIYKYIVFKMSMLRRHALRYIHVI